MRAEDFASFQLSDDDEELLSKNFSLLLRDCRLHSLRPADFSSAVSATSGCYLWLMRLGGSSYKIYVGRTHSIRRRLTDYSGHFQPHSPNDFKLRFFEEFIREVFPAAELDLYFIAHPLEKCGDTEKQLIRVLRPLINSLPPSTAEERELLRAAFSQFYRSALLRRLRSDH